MNDLADVREDIASFAEAVNHQGEASRRLLEAHNHEIARLWEEFGRVCDDFMEELRALANRIESVAQMPMTDYALQNDLDSLRSEMLDRIAEATATPFDPEEHRGN